MYCTYESSLAMAVSRDCIEDYEPYEDILYRYDDMSAIAC